MVKISKQIILFLAYLANLVYVDFKLLTKEKLQGKNYKTIAINGTEVLIVWDDENIYISFRGTEVASLKDFITDAKIKKVSFIWGNVHRGFLEALEGIWDEIEAELKELAPNRKLYITGHSLGGALATLASVKIYLAGYDLAGVVTFGSPRVGDIKFSEFYNRELKHITYRYVNDNDIVPNIPLELMGFSHIGTLFFFDSDGKVYLDKNLVWWYKTLLKLNGRIEALQEGDYLDGLSDHDMQEYLLLIGGNRKRR